MIYRVMRTGDHEQIMDLWQRCEGVSLRDADSPQGIDRYLRRNPDLSFVALDSSTLVGTIMSGHDARRGYIQHLAVDPAWRGQGVASRLLTLCLEALAEQGIVKSHVHVIAANKRARDFWSGRDFRRREEIVMYSFINGDNENA